MVAEPVVSLTRRQTLRTRRRRRLGRPGPGRARDADSRAARLPSSTTCSPALRRSARSSDAARTQRASSASRACRQPRSAPERGCWSAPLRARRRVSRRIAGRRLRGAGRGTGPDVVFRADTGPGTAGAAAGRRRRAGRPPVLERADRSRPCTTGACERGAGLVVGRAIQSIAGRFRLGGRSRRDRLYRPPEAGAGGAALGPSSTHACFRG